MVDYAHFLSHVARGGQVSAIRRLGQMAVPAGTISFTSGYPDPATYPWEEFRQITADLLASHDASVLQYGPTRGCRDLLEGLIDILAGRGIRATIGDLLVTTGSQQGIDLVGRAMIDPGDVVLFELPAYPGATAAFRNLQANLAGVKQEADGIDLDDLDAVMLRERCAGHRVRLLYVVPNFQNPTGLILSRSKRQRLLEWASRRDVVVLEDDPYGELYFDGSAGPADTRPIKADDAEGRVVYLSSFSKTLAAGLRVGWIAAPEPLATKFEQSKQTQDILTSALDQRLVAETWKRGLLASRLPMLRSVYCEKRNAMERAFRREAGDLIEWTQPHGGFFLWLSLPGQMDAEALLAAAIEGGVVYVPGKAFFVDGTGSQTLRLSFSLASPDRIAEGVRRLCAVVKHEMDRRP